MAASAPAVPASILTAADGRWRTFPPLPLPPPTGVPICCSKSNRGSWKKKRTHRDAGMRTNLCENRTQDNETGIQESQRVFFFYTRRFERIWKAAIRAESSGGHRAALLCAGRRCRNALSPGTFWLSAHGSHRGGGTQEQNQSVGWKKKKHRDSRKRDGSFFFFFFFKSRKSSSVKEMKTSCSAVWTRQRQETLRLFVIQWQ